MTRIGLFLIVVLALTGQGPLAQAVEKSRNGPIQKVTMKLLEYGFEPADITLHSGHPVELVLINEGRILHEFVTDAFRKTTMDVETNGVITEALGVAELEIPAGAAVTLRFTPGSPGDFALECHAREPADHLEQGMVGTIRIVTD
jgi:uncharacterized cupredoxin-like copper-binding protein